MALDLVVSCFVAARRTRVWPTIVPGASEVPSLAATPEVAVTVTLENSASEGVCYFVADWYFAERVQVLGAARLAHAAAAEP